MLTRPLVSVIIPVYRDWERLSLCLDALAAQSVSPDLFEIIVANNEPEENHVPERMPQNARIIHVPKPGSYTARNVAVNDAAGAFLAFTDSDCIPDRDWIRNGVAALQRNRAIRVAGPVPIFREEGGRRWAHLHDFHTAFRVRESVERTGTPPTANLFVAKETFEYVGPFNDRLFSGGDTEWGRRAQAANIPVIYDEGVIVAHPARRSLRDIFRKRRRIAGAHATVPGFRVFRYVLRGLKPPFRQLMRHDRGPTTLAERLILFIVAWISRVQDSLEALQVAIGLKSPNRS